MQQELNPLAETVAARLKKAVTKVATPLHLLERLKSLSSKDHQPNRIKYHLISLLETRTLGLSCSEQTGLVDDVPTHCKAAGIR